MYTTPSFLFSLLSFDDNNNDDDASITVTFDSPCTIFSAFKRMEFVAEELNTRHICLMGVKNGFIIMENEIFLTSFPTNFKLASSTSSADRKEPSPNLFNCSKGGNSNSIKGKEVSRGRSMAFLVASIAILSRTSSEDGIFAAAVFVDASRCDDDDDDVDNVGGTKESTHDISRKSNKVVI